MMMSKTWSNVEEQGSLAGSQQSEISSKQLRRAEGIHDQPWYNRVSAACQQGQVVSRASGSQHGHPQGIQSGPTIGASIMANHCRIKEAYGPTVGRTSSWRTNRFEADRGDSSQSASRRPAPGGPIVGSALRKPSSCWTVEAEVFTEAEINANIIQSTHNSEATTNPNTNKAVHGESHEAFHDRSPR